MTLPVFLTQVPLAAASQTLRVGPEVAAHAVKVRRLGPGERLQLIDGTGVRVTGTITAASPAEVTVRVDGVETDSLQRPALTLVQALAKSDRDLQAIEAATELGVDHVIPWAANRSIVDWPDKKAQKMAAKWENVLVAATLQSRRSRIPTLGPLVRGRAVAGLGGADTRVIVLNETATAGLSAAVADLVDVARIAVVVGPEGGITPEELDALVAAGAYPAVLGQTILRTSTAGPAALAVIQHLLGRWH